MNDYSMITSNLNHVGAAADYAEFCNRIELAQDNRWRASPWMEQAFWQAKEHPTMPLWRRHISLPKLHTFADLFNHVAVCDTRGTIPKGHYFVSNHRDGLCTHINGRFIGTYVKPRPEILDHIHNYTFERGLGAFEIIRWDCGYLVIANGAEHIVHHWLAMIDQPSSTLLDRLFGKRTTIEKEYRA